MGFKVDANFRNIFVEQGDALMECPLVSVLVPSCNHGQFLEERIESIVKQTYRRFELIVIDDRSNDDSDLILKNLQIKYGFRYIRNKYNSGTPFAAWERICRLAKGKYIWICESDDVAEHIFLATAVDRLEANPSAVMFYSNSWILDEQSNIVGHSETYFHDTWRETRWDSDFSARGIDELANYQLRGQTVPNMSSALFKADAFRNAFDPYLKRLKLTGDWLFVGDVLRAGDVEFCSQPLSYFRKHDETARVRVQSARSQAEFILTKYRLFLNSGKAATEFASVMGSDVIRFLYEPASWWEVLKAAMSISFKDTIWCALLLLRSTLKNPIYYKKFRERFNHAKQWWKEQA